MRALFLPHPVLLPEGTDYKEEFKFDIDITKKPQHTLDGDIVLTVGFDLKSKFIHNMIQHGMAKICIVIKCAKTHIRKTIFKHNDQKIELKLPFSDYYDRITLSSYIAATKPIYEFKSNEHHEEFSEVSINLPVGAILARASDANLKIDSLQTLNAAIQLVTNNELKDGEYVVDVSDDYIKIFMTESMRQQVNALRQTNNRILFPSIYMVALTHAIQKVTEDGTKVWEEALRNTLIGYDRKITDDLKSNAYRHAQMLLKYPTTFLRSASHD